MITKERKYWNFKTKNEHNSLASQMSEVLGISSILSKLIINRGYESVDEANLFLTKGAEVMRDPFLLNDMDIGARRILDAIKNGEVISIFGDYDVDGVTSVSILHLYLESLGAKVNYYIPSRKGEGYGVSEYAVRKLHSNGTRLIITVDTGITATNEVNLAKELGIDVVITDHHECYSELPDAVAVINPKRLDSKYPFSSLAGVGVVFKLLCALEYLHSGEEMIDCVRRISLKYSDLTAIGTIADVMPVKDENRLIVSLGLSLIDKTDKIGLKALVNLCRTNETKTKARAQKKISSGFVGFTIAPRINAAGRISEASIAVELFLSKDENFATNQALLLCDINKDRQLEENRIAEEAYMLIEENGYAEESVILLDNPHWNHGVIGIVASRVSERYSVPAILVSFEGNDDPDDPEAIGKGSGRSVSGMNLVEALSSCSDLLEKFGGHELAAGLTVKRKNIPALRERLSEYAKKCFEESTPNNAMDVDLILSPNDITLALANELNLLEPYGVSNPVPVFAMQNVIVEDIVPISMNRHLKLTLSKNGHSFTAMLFCVSSQEFSHEIYDEVDVAFNVEVNEFMNTKNVQLNIKDIRTSQRIYDEQTAQEDEFSKIKSGASLLPPEDIIPQREDFALVYSFLVKEARDGKEKYTYIKLLHSIKKKYSNVTANYVKIKLIIKVFRELNLISIEEIDDLGFKFKINFSKNKTNLEKSSILRKVKALYTAK